MSTAFDSSSSSTSGSPSKRSREESEMPDEGLIVDEAAQAKIARKEARVIRNRESAQRSRNQRKHYLAGLEVRNRELEEEVRRLRAQSPETQSKIASISPTPREASPEQTVLTLAGELGIPPQMVSSGVSLSAVAPPPPDAEVDVKQEVVTATAPVNPEIDRLLAQNSALTQRVSMLENLLKQVVAVSNFGGLEQPTQPTIVDTMPIQPTSAVDETFDINSFIQSNSTDTPITPTSTSFPITPINSNLITTSFHPVACHSAAVATSVSYEGEAQQRARGTGTKLDSRLITKERLVKVARILGALAELRGWTLSPYPQTSSVWSKSVSMVCRSRIKNARRRPRRGMRG